MEIPREFFRNMYQAVMVTDQNGKIIYVNQAFITITGYTLEEAVGNTPRLLSSGKQSRDFYQQLWTSLQRDGCWHGELCNRRKDGSLYTEWLSITAVYGPDSQLQYYMAVFTDISQQRQIEERIHYEHSHDALTDAFNLRYITEVNHTLLSHANRTHTRVALVYIDLDGFKAVNDNYGHQVGDQYLIAVAQLMQNALRKNDLVARIGGDEFLVVLSDLYSLRDVQDAVYRLQETLITFSFPVNGEELAFAMSIGVAVYPDDADSWDKLLLYADRAMYEIKKSSKNAVGFHSALQP